MPIRMLRDWTDSDKVNSISSDSERFFTRLIMKADDFGAFYADTRLLKANLFPLLLDKVREADITRWMAECQKAGLIALYESGNKKYVQIIDFKQRMDKARAKFPLFTDSLQFPGNSGNIPAEIETETERKPNTETEKDGGFPPAPVPYFSDEEKERFKNFQVWIEKYAPRVAKMKDPFTIQQYLALCNKGYNMSQIRNLLLDMHNWADLHKKKVSAYLTLLNWKRREEK